MRQAGKAVAALGLIIAGCVTLDDIQRTRPLRRLQFPGSHKAVADCVHRRIGGKMREGSPQGTYVVYDSAKADHSEGLTHYAITFGAIDPGNGFAEWRILAPPSSDRGRRRERPTGVTETAVRQYWRPVEECATSPSRP